MDSNLTTLWIPGVDEYPGIDFILDVKSTCNEERTLYILQTSVKEEMHDGPINFFEKVNDFAEDKDKIVKEKMQGK
jgi:hypothetical protein